MDASAEPQDGRKPRSAEGRRVPRVAFHAPAGASAYYAPQSVAWRVFKNPVTLFIGGVTAVVLELAEPRVRGGVWGHSIFPTNPLTRMLRTGMVAQATVYAPRAEAERMIAMVNRMHARVSGATPCGQAYDARDPALLDWVQATAGFGFMEAYHRYARRLSASERDQSYLEAGPIAALFGAHGAPKSVAEQQAQFAAMLPLLEPHPIVDAFLTIMMTAPLLPRPLRPLQRSMVRAGVSLLPEEVRSRLDLGDNWAIRGGEARLLGFLARLADVLPLPGTPAFQACRRTATPLRSLYLRGGVPLAAAPRPDGSAP